MADDILQRLTATTNPAQKAALVANFALSREDPALAELVPILAFLRWFDESVMAALLPETEQPRGEELFARLIELPFVERVTYGYALHDLTRQGLLAQTTAEQRLAAAHVSNIYAQKEDSESMLESLYCMVLGEQSEVAQIRLENSMYAAANQEDWGSLLTLFDSLHEAESIVGYQVVERSPLHWLAQGLARRDQGDLTGAIQDYDRAIQLNPAYALAYNNLGLTRYQQGDLIGAIQDYNRAIQLEPQLSAAYNNRGNAHRDQGDLARAIQDYSQAIKLNPTYADAYNNRGVAHSDQGDLAAAIQDHKQAIALLPDGPDKSRALRGIDTALSRIWQFLHEVVLNYLRRVEFVYQAGLAFDDLAVLAEDFVQDALVKLSAANFALLDKFQGRGQFSSWVAQFALNEARMDLRKSNWRLSDVDELDFNEFPTASEHENLEHRVVHQQMLEEVSEVLQACIDKLMERQRIVFYECVVRGRTAQEVAGQVGVTENAVRILLHRAKLKLRRCLEQSGIGLDSLSE